ncbi:MAG TPA: DUF3037 domain-containing protein [Tepidisphaeraceae bacterium]|jgi:hypothetical protein|nr:DUF3037 domain-containing protein [Tepidisphaeraceae bacterium]
MTELVCNYAILRFLPYKEIGEFINVGVVVHSPEINFFDYSLAPRRNRRVRLFFPELDTGVYKAGIGAIERELGRLRNTEGLFTGVRKLNAEEIGHGLTVFRSLLQRREALFSFASPGTLLGDPYKSVGELYERYVERQFAREQGYQEREMQSQLSQWMSRWGLRTKYRTGVRVGDAMFHLTLPFVHLEEERPIRAIKPLDLDKKDPTAVFEHGDIWVQRMRRLAERNLLPDRTVFTIRLPETGDVRMAADTVVSDLRELPRIESVPFEETDELRHRIEV